MTATYTLAELQRQGFALRGDQLIRVARDGVALSGAAEAIEPDETAVTWKRAQSECRKVFVDGGCEVYWLSQARKTGQTAGLSDLIVFGPPGAPFHLYWETKHGAGKLSEAQRKFALHCQRTGTRYAAGSPAIAKKTLRILLDEYSTAAAR